MRQMMIVGLAMIGFGLASARAGGLACAVNEAIEGNTTTIEWTGHKFQIRPVEVVDKEKRTHVLTGTLLYVNGKQKDETLTYRITKNGGALKTVEVQIGNGMWLPLSPEMSAALGDYRKTGNIEEEKRNAIQRALYKAGEGSWTKTAELIVALIGISHC